MQADQKTKLDVKLRNFEVNNDGFSQFRITLSPIAGDADKANEVMSVLDKRLQQMAEKGVGRPVAPGVEVDVKQVAANTPKVDLKNLADEVEKLVANSKPGGRMDAAGMQLASQITGAIYAAHGQQRGAKKED